MSRIDLNIVDRGVKGTDWIAESTGLTPDHLDEVLEQKTDNCGALNSLPTPFARFFVAREAFRRAMEEHISPQKESGFAYRQLVSDILDVYELLFNLNYHKNNSWKDGQKVELREWIMDENMGSIKEKMPVLYNSINDYYKTDITEDRLYFLVYTEEGKDLLLACSSPYTGFVTPPDLDKQRIKKDGSQNTVFAGTEYQDLHIRRKSKGEYFRDIQMFEDRESDFKNYMYNILFGSALIDDRLKSIKDYIRSFETDKQIRNDLSLSLTEIISDQNDNIVINGLEIKANDEVDVNSYFRPTLIKVPYKINRNGFDSIKYKNDIKDRDYDYLIPFKPEIYDIFADHKIDADIHIKRNSVTVELRHNGRIYKKDYCADPATPSEGRILDLKQSSINFDLGLFPNILSNRAVENSYFKIMVIGADENPELPNFNIEKISLGFYNMDDDGVFQIRECQNNQAQFGVLPTVIRSRQKKDDIEGGTKFYELFNTAFDLIEIEIMGERGLVRPLWEISANSQHAFTYAIDLGTSNTFMSRCKVGDNNLPELFTLDRQMVSYLHESEADKQKSLNRRIEDSIFGKAKNRIKTEFLPAIIDGKDYKFPIRTALCGVQNKVGHPQLFDHQNIAFFYEKMMSQDDQNVLTDIKWQSQGESIKLFIQELLLIVKCDILQRGGDLSKTQLVWFRPLSFAGNIRQLYVDTWENEAKKILCIDANQIHCYSESEAPYYFFKKKNYISDSEAVSVIDIGGGSTDFVYFESNKPVMANSVHFGCDVLWGNGFAEFDNERLNGIYNRYKDTLRFQNDGLDELNSCFKNVDNKSTKDIINFWLSNASFCDINKNLSNDFKPVFVYHFTSILYYMAQMYKEFGHKAPKTIIFSGNGSKYIDGFLCSDREIIRKMINHVFEKVFGEEQNVFVQLPLERKESTCYGGLYREPNAPAVPEKTYQGYLDSALNFSTIGDINNNYKVLKDALLKKYREFSDLYKEILDLLKKEKILDNTCNTTIYANEAQKDMGVSLDTYYKSQFGQKYTSDVELFDSVFFLPIVQRVFEMTQL